MEDIYKEYEKRVHSSAKLHGHIPHCDSNVLHSPGTCNYCDKHVSLQDFRMFHGMAFTNEEFDPNRHKFPCPAQQNRPLETIERWGGNIAHIDLRDA